MKHYNNDPNLRGLRRLDAIIGNITFSHFSVCSLDFTLALISYKPCNPGRARKTVITASEETERH